MALAGSLFGPTLPAGNYTVKLMKGKDTYTTEFTLKYDEDSPYSSEDRTIQYEYTRKLYDMTEDLAYIYYVLEEITKQSKDRAEKDTKQSKKLLALAETTEQLGGSLVALGGDFYVDEDEEMIGELISQLYRYVSSYPGRPSDSQIDRVKVLSDKMDQVKEKFDALVTLNLTKINERLQKDEIQPITFMNKEEFMEK